LSEHDINENILICR